MLKLLKKSLFAAKGIGMVLVMSQGNSLAQQRATITEGHITYPTYGYHDPSMLASKALYPYFRFDGFSHKAEDKSWKVVTLENDFIKVQVMPEIGGKVWTAIDKSNNKPFLYNNDVVKFRDIALRGPWISGGIEFNFGIIGHAPSSSSPVDYEIKRYGDGTVACLVSNIEMISRTRWIVEIRLEKDKSYFETKTYWINLTNQEQAFYNWSNAAVKASDRLKFEFPGDTYIGHEGETGSWPIDDEQRDLSYYKNNAFGGAKSYHVTGLNSNFFATLDAEPQGGNFGTVHFARRDEKLGKKIFLWSQADDGIIWERLLTDKAGQYVEIQSGKLFNQNVLESSKTPFKQHSFSPYETETWSEYWFPIKEIDTISNVNLLGAFAYTVEGLKGKLSIAAVRNLQDSIYVYDKHDKVLFKDRIHLLANQTSHIQLALNGKGDEAAQVRIGAYRLDLELVSDGRPDTTARASASTPVQEWYVNGREYLRFRKYKEAEDFLEKALAIDGSYIPALLEMAKLRLLQFDYGEGKAFAERALAIDTYNGAANYYGGLAMLKLQESEASSRGMFEVAALDPAFRKAAYIELGKSYMRSQSPLDAVHYFQNALDIGGSNLEVLQSLYYSMLMAGQLEDLDSIAERMLTLDPFGYLQLFEGYYQNQDAQHKDALLAKLTNEFPNQTLMEMGIWFVRMGLPDRATKLFELCGKQVEALYWLAWLHRDQVDRKAFYFKQLEGLQPLRIFPFREEEADLLQWAMQERPGLWQTNYLLALLLNARGEEKKAATVLSTTSQQGITFAPYHILKAHFSTDKVEHLKKAYLAEPKEWRYVNLYSKALFDQGKDKEAIALLEQCYRETPDNYTIGFELIKKLARTGQYERAEVYLKTIDILPFEGAQEARNYYRYVYLKHALALVGQGDLKHALRLVDAAQQWPSNLGVGKPFDVNNDLEHAVEALIYGKMKKTGDERRSQERVINREVLHNPAHHIDQLIKAEDSYMF